MISIRSAARRLPSVFSPGVRVGLAARWIFLVVVGIGLETGSSASILLQESFDTRVELSADRFDLHGASYRLESGLLTLVYSSYQTHPPSGIECTVPTPNIQAAERTLEIHFPGGGSELSNSLFISYALSPGPGLALPLLPAGTKPNSRSGYILRFIHHGDGTNELKAYRIDEGWSKELKSVWIPSNPITTIRRLIVRHSRAGRHRLDALFDTGQPVSVVCEFEDATYDPDDGHRGFQVTVKGHAGISALVGFATDTWRMTETPLPNPLPRRVRTEPPRRPMRVDMVLRSKEKLSEQMETARRERERGRTDAAYEVCTSILVLEPNHDDALDLRGQIDFDRQNFLSARAHWTAALGIRENLHGLNHPDVSATLERLGDLYRLKDPAEAERCYQRALRIREETQGMDHPAVGALTATLAQLYQTQERYPESERMYERALAIQDRAGPSARPEISSLLSRLTQVYLAQGRYAEAESPLNRSLSVQESMWGDTDPRLMPTLLQLETVYEKLARLSNLAAIYRRIIRLTEILHGPRHPDLARRLENLGYILTIDRQYAEAERLIKRGLDISRAAMGPDHPEVANGLFHLGSLYLAQNRLSDAEPLFQESLSIRRKSLGPHHPKLINVLNQLTQLYRRQKRFPDVESTYLQELAVKEQVYGRDHPDVADCMNNLGVHHYQLGRYLKAETYFVNALRIKEKVLGPDHPDLITMLENLSRLYIRMDRPADARKIAVRSRQIRERHPAR